MYNERSLQAYCTINKRVNILLIKKGVDNKRQAVSHSKGILIYVVTMCKERKKHILKFKGFHALKV